MLRYWAERGPLLIRNCRSCSSPSLTPVMDFGEIHFNAFPQPGEPDPPKAPIQILLCESCALAQLAHNLDPNQFFKGESYWYRSGVTSSMWTALEDIAEGVKKRVQLRRGDLIVSIGTNDGTELRPYEQQDLELVGFEPSALAELARETIPEASVVNDYWSLAGLRGVTGKKAKSIQAIACFYDVPDPNRFLSDVRDALAQDGQFVIQLTGLKHTLQNNDIGNILTHEHVMLYSLTSLIPLFERNGLHIWDYEENEVNGGSARIWAMPKKPPARSFRLLTAHSAEKWQEMDSTRPYTEFMERAEEIKERVVEFVQEEKAPYGLGASTKANGMFQWWGLNRANLLGCSDRDPRKHGREMVGSRIPILPESIASAAASGFVLGPFGFRSEIVKREQEFLERGGRILCPFPEPEVISAT